MNTSWKHRSNPGQGGNRPQSKHSARNPDKLRPNKRGRNAEEKKKRKKKDEDSSDESDSEKAKNAAKKAKSEQGFQYSNIRIPSFNNLYPIEKVFWGGKAGENPPSEELKSLRRSIGIVAKGNLSLCPPPVTSLDACTGSSSSSSGSGSGSVQTDLPACFAQTFKLLGHKCPTPVQMQCWPAMLSGANVLGIAPTGSGKTYAYGLPMIPHVEAVVRRQLRDGSGSGGNGGGNGGGLIRCAIQPIVLVLVPTRELAIQVSSAFKVFKRVGMSVRGTGREGEGAGGAGEGDGATVPITTGVVYGGMNKEDVMDELLRQGAAANVAAGGGTSGAGGSSSGGGGGIHILVATPGRLLDLVVNNKRDFSLSRVSYFVLDEGDKMLDLGFTEQINAIASQIRPDRQTLLFTATFPGRLREIANRWMGAATAGGDAAGAGSASSAGAATSNQVIIRCSGLEFDGNSTNAKGESSDSAVAQVMALLSGGGGAGAGAGSSSAAVTVETGGDGAGDDENALSPGPPSSSSTSSRSGKSATTLTVNRDIEQLIHVCATHKKPRLLLRRLQTIREEEKAMKVRQPAQILIFCGKTKTIGFVLDFLKKQNIPCVDKLCGSMQQDVRERVLANFKAGKINVLIATDVAARGIHIKRLKHVINYDFPSNLEQYCHRVGRAGRDNINKNNSYNNAVSSSSSADAATAGAESGAGMESSTPASHAATSEPASSSAATASSPTAAAAVAKPTREWSGFAYSFFTRNMAPLANDLISILEKCNQVVEPNLRQLATDFKSGLLDSCDAFGDENEGYEEEE